MSPTVSDRVRVAAENIRVPRDEFVAVWQEAGRREAGGGQDTDWYLGAVVQTCRWMAAVPLRSALCGGLTRSPVTLRSCRARPELIEAECRAAQRQEHFSPELAARPGWCEGVRATFRWAWRRQGPPPFALQVPPSRGTLGEGRHT